MLVSVIIPTLNRSRSLDRTLFSIASQQDAGDYEVIVVDNGSADSTRDVAERYRGRIPRLAYIYDDRPGLMIGRHVGASRAEGEILTFIDDDVMLPPSWLRSVGELFRSDRAVCLATGNNHPFFECPPPAWLKHMWNRGGRSCRYLHQLSLLDFGSYAGPIDPGFVWGLNYHIRRESFNAVGGFHPDILPAKFLHFIGDGETGIAHELKKGGHQAFLDPRLTLYHCIPAERLHEEYFLKRSAIEGMMTAYADVRRGGAPESLLKDKTSKVLKYSLKRSRTAVRSPKAYSLMIECRKKFIDGYNSYLMRIMGDPPLLDYVREPSYLDSDKVAATYYGQ